MWFIIAKRNLAYDRRRFLASLAGVCFSVTLVVVQLGLFVGLAANSSEIIDRSPGQIWIAGRKTGNFQWGRLIPRRTLTIVRSTSGVAWAREILVGWAQIKDLDGGMPQFQVIGFDLAGRVGAPWNVVEGNLDELAIPGRVVLDRSAAGKIGHFELGDHREVFGYRVRVAAITEGITSFTTVPLFFSSLETARHLTGSYIRPNETMYVVAGLRPEASEEATVRALRRRLPYAEVFTSAGFSWETRRYWMLETGMGIGFLLTSLLAIAVGTVIVSQTIYAATNEHFPEYGTLKAMGMRGHLLSAVVVTQALIAALAGALPGSVIGVVVVRFIQSRGLQAVVAPELIVLTILAALAASALAAGTSVRRVRNLEPAMVFRG